MKKLIFCFTLLFFALKFYSQSAWNLQQCIEHAWKNNLNLKQSQINTQLSGNTLTQSKANTLPSLNAGAQHTYNIGRTIDRYTNTFANSTVLSQNFYVQAQVTLWSGLSQYNTIMQNRYQWASAKETYEQQKNDLALNVASAFLQVVYTEELINVSLNQVNISKEQLERTSKLVEAGALAKGAELDVKAQLANDEFSLVTAKNNYSIALLSLKQLLSLDSLNSFTIQKPNLSVNPVDLSSTNVYDIYVTALKNQHSIKSAEFSLKGYEKALVAAKGRVSPSLSLSGSIGTGYSGLAKDITGISIAGYDTSGITTGGDFVLSPLYTTTTKETPFADQFKNNVNKSIGLTLAVPLFNGLSTYTAVKNAQLQVLNGKYAYDLSKQQLYKTIAQAYADANASLEKYNSAKISKEAAELSFLFSKQKYEAGGLSAIDFSTSKNRLLSAESQLINAQFDYVFKLKVLDFYQGKALTFD